MQLFFIIGFVKKYRGLLVKNSFSNAEIFSYF